MGTAVEVYHGTLAELYDCLISCPIEKLHRSNHEHDLTAALRAGHVEAAEEVSRNQVDILHRIMFMGLEQDEPLRSHPSPYWRSSSGQHFCHRWIFEQICVRFLAEVVSILSPQEGQGMSA